MSARTWCAAAVLLWASACTHRSLAPSPANPNVITEEEIRAAHSPSMYDLIARLRPNYLKDRGPVSIMEDTRDVATVFLNVQEYGPIAILRNVQPDDISEVRYYSGIDAVTKFGRKYGGGVIQLISRYQQ